MPQLPTDAEIAAFSTPLSNTLDRQVISNRSIEDVDYDMDKTVALIRSLQQRRKRFVEDETPVPPDFDEVLSKALDE